MAEQHFQIGVKGLIQNSAGHILMVRIPKWGDNPAHWDFPGGRMDPGESFLQTLGRELQEEIGTSYIGEPKQITAMLTNIKIPVGDVHLPLVFVIYKTQIAADAHIVLDPESPEEAFEWFPPAEAAHHMAIKFSTEFCDYVANL